MSIFLCGSFRSSAITRKKTPTTPAKPSATPWQHRPRARLERQRLEEEDRLEPLAVDAREAERDEPDDLRRGDRDAAPGRIALLLARGGPAGSPASRPGGRTS